jgi:predicted metal-dependent hydrolase
VSGGTVLERGRPKAYRPMPAAERRAALVAGLAAYDRGDWFLAHELLEPAWMGTADPAERALHGGLIKLAAAGVHATRGNPSGIAKNLAGARLRLASLAGHEPGERPARDIDVAGLVAAIDARLAAEAVRPTTGVPPPIPRRA